MKDRLIRVLGVSAVALGINSGCDSASFNRTHLGIPRNSNDTTLVARRKNFEIYEYCGPDKENARPADTYSGEDSRVSNLGDRGIVQVIKLSLPQKHGVQDDLATLLNGDHEITVKSYEADIDDYPKEVDSMSVKLSC